MTLAQLAAGGRKRVWQARVSNDLTQKLALHFRIFLQLFKRLCRSLFHILKIEALTETEAAKREKSAKRSANKQIFQRHMRILFSEGDL